jgi:hypothetical protein
MSIPTFEHFFCVAAGLDIDRVGTRNEVFQRDGVDLGSGHVKSD